MILLLLYLYLSIGFIFISVMLFRDFKYSEKNVELEDVLWFILFIAIWPLCLKWTLESHNESDD